MKKVDDFYTEAALLRLSRRRKIWTGVFFTLVLGAFAACIVLIAITNVHRVWKTEVPVIIISGAVGCVAIFVYVFGVDDARRESEHIKTMLSHERETVRGRATAPGRVAMRLPGSITARSVSFESDEGARLLSVNEKYVKKLPLEKTIEFFIRGGYITGWSEDEND